MNRLIFKVVVRKEGNAIPLTLEQHRKIPCLSLLSSELEEKFFEVNYKPQRGVSEDDILQVHLNALASKYDIISHEKYNDLAKRL